jgi:hypothetical protein
LPLLLEGVGDVLEEDQAEDDVLVLRGVEVATQLVGCLPETERYAHVTAGQQREAADLLELAVTGLPPSVTRSVTEPADGVVSGGTESPGVGLHEREIGSGGRIRTYGQAVNSRPLYH